MGDSIASACLIYVYIWEAKELVRLFENIVSFCNVPESDDRGYSPVFYDF